METAGKNGSLFVDQQEREEAENDCRKVSDSIASIYRECEKGTAINAELDDETVEEALDVLEGSGCPVYFSEPRMNMRNYRKMERFLEQSQQGRSGEILVYELCTDGGIGRNKFIFDGRKLYVLYTRSTWTTDGQLIIQETEFSGIREWSYTEKGWFCYEFCVPEPPEASERVNGNRMVRVKPQKSEYREIANRYLWPIGYQGNNLLCSDWDAEHLEDLDYTGLYESFYFMKNQKRCTASEYPDGIPREEFENLMQEYLPVTTEQLRDCAAFDEEKQVYLWGRLGCLNYAPTVFGTSIPEITDLREHDTTAEITIDAVCERAGNDCVMRHVLTVQVTEDGELNYLGNRICGDGLKKIPAYQYRMGNSD